MAHWQNKVGGEGQASPAKSREGEAKMEYEADPELTSCVRKRAARKYECARSRQAEWNAVEELAERL